MENIALNNGQNAIISSNGDIVELIKEQFSFELGKRLENILDNLETKNQELISDYGWLEKEKDELEEENNSLETENWQLQQKLKELKNELEEIKQKPEQTKKRIVQDVLEELETLPFC